jgi:hypothetical protein
MRLFGALLLTTAVCTAAIASEEWFDRLEQSLTFAAPDDAVRARLGGLLTLEGYQVEQPPPGLVFTEGHRLFNPRLELSLHGQFGPRVLGFVQATVDRGFDPGANPLRLRLEEYAVTLLPWAGTQFQVQLGQFSTVIGNWVARHDAWDNPFVGAPLPYEHLTAINDSVAPASPAAFVAFDPDERYEYNPIIWGPSYATGVAVAARRGRFEIAAELKNTGPASRPEDWPLHRVGFDRPAVAARLGFRPDLRWSLGLSASDSVYYSPAAAATLPAGTSRRDYRARLLGHDFGFAWHHLQIWGEIFHARFEVPRVGIARTVAGYVETKYKFTPQLFGAVRWNRQVFATIPDGRGGRLPWGADRWRIDLATGYRFTSHLALKVQASVENGDTPGARLRSNWATQFALRF